MRIKTYKTTNQGQENSLTPIVKLYVEKYWALLSESYAEFTQAVIDTVLDTPGSDW